MAQKYFWIIKNGAKIILIFYSKIFLRKNYTKEYPSVYLRKMTPYMRDGQKVLSHDQYTLNLIKGPKRFFPLDIRCDTILFISKGTHFTCKCLQKSILNDNIDLSSLSSLSSSYFPSSSSSLSIVSQIQ